MPGLQKILGFEFPTGPGPARVKFPTEGRKWGEIAAALKRIRDSLGTSDRKFYRELIGLEAMALQNQRDRATANSSVLVEPELVWLDGGSGRSSL